MDDSKLESDSFRELHVTAIACLERQQKNEERRRSKIRANAKPAR